MTSEAFRRSLRDGLAKQRKAQRLPAWSFVVGLISLAIAALATFLVIGQFGVPSTSGQWLASMWVVAAWAGAVSLLLFGLVSEVGGMTERVGLAGLWLGNLATSGGIGGFPLALFLFLLPLIIGGLLVNRHQGWRYASAYGALPVIAFLGAIQFQWFSIFESLGG